MIVSPIGGMRQIIIQAKDYKFYNWTTFPNLHEGDCYKTKILKWRNQNGDSYDGNKQN